MMAEASVHVDLFNPGQVFASLGFLELAEVLIGGAEGGFDWSDEADPRFLLRTPDERNPVVHVIEFLAHASLDEVSASEVSPAPEDDGKRRPILLRRGSDSVQVGHWADGSSRDDFKQFAGNQSAFGNIAPALLKEIRLLWEHDGRRLGELPFHELRPLGGSFKLDARAAWTPRDIGYSLDEQKQGVSASPLLEVCGAVGLEHARPWVDPEDKLRVRYGVWWGYLPPCLARAALGGNHMGIECRVFRFTRNAQGPKGEYKQVTFSTEEQIV